MVDLQLGFCSWWGLFLIFAITSLLALFGKWTFFSCFCCVQQALLWRIILNPYVLPFQRYLSRYETSRKYMAPLHPTSKRFEAFSILGISRVCFTFVYSISYFPQYWTQETENSTIIYSIKTLNNLNEHTD